MSLDLARGLSERGHEVTVLSLDNESATSFFDWPSRVVWKRIGIGNPNLKATFFIRSKRLWEIRQVVREIQPDIVIGFQVGSFALLRLSTLGLGIRSIAAERNSPDLFKYIKRGRFKRFGSSLILLSATTIAIQFENYRLLYPKVLKNRMRVTPNWVKERADVHPLFEDEGFEILFIGRLTFQKNASILLEALEHLPRNFSLKIIGDGAELENLKKQANLLPHNIIFLPPLKDLRPHFTSASLLCIPSRWEGFPNVVAESLSFGLPVIGFRECAGIPELITHGVNGFIVPSMNSWDLSQGILNASKSKLDSKIVSNSVRQYSYSNFISSWEKAFD